MSKVKFSNQVYSIPPWAGYQQAPPVPVAQIATDAPHPLPNIAPVANAAQKKHHVIEPSYTLPSMESRLAEICSGALSKPGAPPVEPDKNDYIMFYKWRMRNYYSKQSGKPVGCKNAADIARKEITSEWRALKSYPLSAQVLANLKGWSKAEQSQIKAHKKESNKMQRKWNKENAFVNYTVPTPPACASAPPSQSQPVAMPPTAPIATPYWQTPVTPFPTPASPKKRGRPTKAANSHHTFAPPPWAIPGSTGHPTPPPALFIQ